MVHAIPPVTRAGTWKPHQRTKCPQPKDREVVEGGFVIWKRAEFYTSQTSFIWLHAIMFSCPVLTKTCCCLPRATTGDLSVPSTTNRQNNFRLGECCQILPEELQKSSMARYSIYCVWFSTLFDAIYTHVLIIKCIPCKMWFRGYIFTCIVCVSFARGSILTLYVCDQITRYSEQSKKHEITCRLHFL